MRSIGAHMYRSTGDIFDKFESFRDNGVSQVEKLHSSAPGCFNDPDMLIVGMHGDGNVARVGGCTDEEYKMHFALWCMMGAPLMMGGDIRTMNDFCRELMLNRELIAIDQDPRQGRRITENKARYANPVRMGLLKLLSNRKWCSVISTSQTRRSTCLFTSTTSAYPFYSGFGLELTDIFTGENLGVKYDSFTPRLEGRTCRLFRAKMVQR